MANETAVVVGAGGISNAWFPPLKDEEVNVLAVVDLDIERAKGQLEKYEIDAEASTDMRAMFDKHHPDFVVDLTVPEAHCEVTCAALEAGCHVVGEKPMASSMDEARRMVATSESTGKMFMTSQSRRWDGKHDICRRTVGTGDLGDLTTVNCDFYLGAHFGGFRDEMPSPLILDMSIHHFDLIRFVTGLDPVSVRGEAWNPPWSNYRGDCSSSVVFEMSNGSRVVYNASWCAKGQFCNWDGNWQIEGSKGTIKYANGEVTLHTARDLYAVTKSAAVQLKGPRKTSQEFVLSDFIRCVKRGERPKTDVFDNIHSVAMVFAAVKAVDSGRRVPVLDSRLKQLLSGRR